MFSRKALSNYCSKVINNCHVFFGIVISIVAEIQRLWFVLPRVWYCTMKWSKWSKCSKLQIVLLNNGWFQKISIPYHGWHEYFNPPLPSEIPKCLSPPRPPNSKIANPPSPPEFSTFVSDPLEFLFVCLNLQTNEKLALFPSAKEFCSQFLLRRSSNSSLLTLVHRSYSF